MTGTKLFAVSRHTLRVALGIFLLSPYLIWIAKVNHWTLPEVQVWLSPLSTAIIQSTLSAVFSLVFGFILFLAIQGWGSQVSRVFLEIILLLPNMVPPLFVALSLLSWVTPWINFPYGMGAVVLAHVLVNVGAVAVALDRLVLSKIGGFADAARIMGASRSQFWREVGLPYLKGDLACIFLFVFSLAMTSFSFPLLLAGDRTLTLEIAIFDLIRIDGQWGVAVILAAMQAYGLFVLAWLLPRPFWPSREVHRISEFLGVRSFRWFVFLPLIVVLGGWFVGVGFWHKSFPIELPLVESFFTTLALGLGSGFFHLALFLSVAFVLPHEGLIRFLNGYLAPSAVITGFAFLLLPGEGDSASLFKLMVAITLISFPLLYRWMVHSVLISLHRQVLAARLLGASWSMILFEVIWPQAAPQMLRAAGLAALWASGDFAMTAIVAGHLNTVPLLIEGLVSNYQIEAAQVLMFPLLFLGLGLYGLFAGLVRYVRN